MTSKERKDFLIELKKEINKSTEFICNYPTDEDIVKKELNFIWVEKKGSMIGDDECHYEVIFNTSKNGNPDVASVEVHFEGDNFEDFQGIELPKELMYAEWEYKENNWRKDSRIVYRDRDDGDNSNEDIIERLRKLERLIGADLRDAIWKRISDCKQGWKQIPAAEQEMYRECLALQLNLTLAQKVKQNAENKCELAKSHKSFTGKDDKAYMEGHHLIPLAREKYFQNPLNQLANIVCLCPNCHKKIHYGKDRLKLVEKLWTPQRQKDLRSAGLNVTLEDLQSYY